MCTEFHQHHIEIITAKTQCHMKMTACNRTHVRQVVLYARKRGVALPKTNVKGQAQFSKKIKRTERYFWGKQISCTQM